VSKQLLFVALVCGCAFPAGAFAQTTTPATAATSVLPLGVDASAPQWCSFIATGSGLAPLSATSNASELSASEVRIVDLVDQATLSTRAASATIGVEAACNYPHRVTIRSQNNGLRRATTSTGAGIASAVPYTANLNWGDVGLSFFADGLSESQQERNVETTGAVSGQLVVEIKIIAGATNLGPNRPLGAGEYSDVISIEVGPL
jgi:hypothetical protein